MGQKVNPIGIRVGIIKGWNSVWYEDKKNYKKYLHEDLKIEKFIYKSHKAAGISKVNIERLADKMNVHIHAARPGLLIGKKGADIEVLKKELESFTDRKVYVYINEVKKSEKDAQIVSGTIAQQLENRMPYRRAVKQAIAGAMRNGALGVKVMVSGRLNGAEIARSESYKEGRIPLQTLRADIEYGFSEALTTFGMIGVKVWIYNGDVLSKREVADDDKYTVKRKTK